MADDDEHHRADKGDNEGIAVEPDREGLHQHDDPQAIRMVPAFPKGHGATAASH